MEKLWIGLRLGKYGCSDECVTVKHILSHVVILLLGVYVSSALPLSSLGFIDDALILRSLFAHGSSQDVEL